MHDREGIAYIVNWHNDEKNCVTFKPDKCQCPSSTRSYDIFQFECLLVFLDADYCQFTTSFLKKLEKERQESGRKKPCRL